jgi:Matrixin
VITVRQLVACRRGAIFPIADGTAASGGFSVVDELFPPSWSMFHDTRSLIDRARTLIGKHLHLNLIWVGDDTRPPDWFVHATLDVMRTTYEQVEIGIGRVDEYFIPDAEANGHDVIDDASEAEALTHEVVIHNDGVDIFFIVEYAGLTLGRTSGIPGLCNKDLAYYGSGCVVELADSFVMGQTLSHEVGHYLGLQHVDDEDNLMYPTVPNGGELDLSQRKTMRTHCAMRKGRRSNPW